MIKLSLLLEREIRVDTVSLIKVISALLYPVGLLLVLFVLRWVFKAFSWPWLSRFCALGVLAVFLLASNPMVATWLVAGLEDRYPQQALTDITPEDAIIVLGGGLRIPSEPARHTQIGHGSDRYWYATRLFRAGKGKKIVLAGGNVYAQKGLQGEAHYASELLQEWGVPREAIIIETASRTTQQNLEQVTALLERENISSALLVTSAVHMRRAYDLFRELPISITPASADVLVREQTAPEVFLWIPSAGALQLSTIALHEHYGYWFTQISREWKALTDNS